MEEEGPEENDEADGPHKVKGALTRMRTTDADDIELVFKFRISGRSRRVSILVPPGDKYDFNYAESDYHVLLDGGRIVQIRNYLHEKRNIWYNVEKN